MRLEAKNLAVVPEWVRRLLEFTPISHLKVDELSSEQIVAYVGYRQTKGLVSDWEVI